MNRIKKVSVSTVTGRISSETIAELKKDAKAQAFVGRFYGRATSSKKGVSQFGPWVALVGDFRGIDPNGEMFAGPQLLLPLGICEQAADKLAEDGVDHVDVMVDIYAKYKNIGGTDGYEFMSKTGELPEMEDPLAKLAQKLPPLPGKANTPQLTLTESTAPEAAKETATAETVSAPAAKTAKK